MSEKMVIKLLQQIHFIHERVMITDNYDIYHLLLNLIL